MGFFAWLKRLITRKQTARDIADNSYGNHGGATKLPLEPEKDPWRS